MLFIKSKDKRKEAENTLDESSHKKRMISRVMIGSGILLIAICFLALLFTGQKISKFFPDKKTSRV